MNIIDTTTGRLGERTRKPATFLGTTLQDIRELPESVRAELGWQMDKIQLGEQPDSFKPMSYVGKGAEEIRIKNADGTYRAVYVARFEEAVYVLHVFRKKTDETPQKDMELARARYRQMMELRAGFGNQ